MAKQVALFCLFWRSSALGPQDSGRRKMLTTVALAMVPKAVRAEMTTFDDKLFDVTFPSDFYAIRRTIEGDVVRRGNVIFTAGRLAKAEIVTVEYFPVAEIIAQAEATSFFPGGRIERWKDIGTPDALGMYICERRDNEAQRAARGMAIPQGSDVVPGTLKVDDTTITAEVVTALKSTDMRVGESGQRVDSVPVTRHQIAKYFLLPGGKYVLACWASALEDLWQAGEGDVLINVVQSLKPKELAT